MSNHERLVKELCDKYCPEIIDRNKILIALLLSRGMTDQEAKELLGIRKQEGV